MAAFGINIKTVRIHIFLKAILSIGCLNFRKMFSVILERINYSRKMDIDVLSFGNVQ